MNDPNANKPGYKKTKLGWIPEDWELTYISDNINILLSNVDKHIFNNEGKVFLCNYTDVYKNEYITKELSFPVGSAKEKEIEKFKLKKGDVIITKDSEDRNDIAVPTYVNENFDNLICGYHLAILRPNGNIDGNFLTKLLQLDKISHSFQRRANGITRFGLTKKTIESTLIWLPPLPEQQKIAQILSTWDKAIEKTEQLIEKKHRLKKGLMQQLLSGKVRFPEFNEPWKKVKLGKIFNERNESGFNNLPLLAITDQSGVVYRNQVDKRDTSNPDKSKYKRICPGDIGYNTMRLWQGRSALAYLEGIVSPAYTVVTPTDEVDALFMSYFFKLPKTIHLFFRYSQGLVSDTLNCKYKHFKLVNVIIPPKKEEQKRIANILKKQDKEIEYYNAYLNKLKQQKQGLMQQLLTGKIRVKTE